LWYAIDDLESATLASIFATHLILRLVEMTYPAHPQWKQTSRDLLIILAITLFGLIFLEVVRLFYLQALAAPLAEIRQSFGTDVWPDQSPLWLQILLLYFASEFIFYWIHRAIHNSSFLWRLSGHGFHHAFHNLHAINFLTSHPLEIFFLAIPIVLLSLLLGAPAEAFLGASMLLGVNAAFAHANVGNKNPFMGLLFTTCDQHRLHHSNVLAESNTNYSCNAIIWDRLFGTYSKGVVEQTGTGPVEPSFTEKLLLPIREPESVHTAPR